MKKIIFVLNLILLLSVFGFSQKQKTSPDTTQERTPVKKQNSSKTTQNNDVLVQSGTSIEAQLEQTLDVKKTSVGDEVILTTTKAIKQNGQTVVRKGSRLVGRVTEVQQKTKENAQSKLGVIFDRIEGKNLNAPISATIVSIMQATVNSSVDDSLSSEISGSSAGSGSVSRTNSGGGGLLGGAANTVGSVVKTTNTTVGGVANTATGTIGGTTQTLGRTVNGIQISQSSNTSADGSATISSQTKNLRLEKGVTFQLRLNESVEN
jgi:hypothetical protein